MKQEINIQRLKLDDIEPAEYNPRVELNEMDDEYQNIKRSITEFGYVDPIIYNKRTNRIVGGHQRYTVLRDLGYDEADISVVDVDEQDEMALNVALNKVEGEWDKGKLKDVLEKLEQDKLEFTGFDEDEINSIVNDINMDDFMEDENEQSNDAPDDHDSRLETALELLGKTHDMLQDSNDYYKTTELYQSVEYFLGEQ